MTIPTAASDAVGNSPSTTAMIVAPSSNPRWWRKHAACLGLDPNMFIPVKTGGCHDYREAREVCKRCAVTAECLAYALDTNERMGMWGGLSPKERRQLRREKRIA